MAKYCSECGTEHRDDDRFCGVCGKPFLLGLVGSGADPVPLPRPDIDSDNIDSEIRFWLDRSVRIHTKGLMGKAVRVRYTSLRDELDQLDYQLKLLHYAQLLAEEFFVLQGRLRDKVRWRLSEDAPEGEVKAEIRQFLREEGVWEEYCRIEQELERLVRLTTWEDSLVNRELSERVRWLRD